MRRLLLAAPLLLGCGRLGFDATTDASLDAPPDTIADTSGVYEVGWARGFGATGSSHAYAIASSPGGGFTVAGELGGPADLGGGTLPNTGGSIFAAAYDPDGAHRWSRAFGGFTTGALGIASDADGVYLSAGFSGTANFGGATFMAISDKPFVAALDHAGAHRWSYRANGAFIMSTSIAVASGIVAITGLGDGTVWNFGGADLSSTSTSIDMFAAAYRTGDGAHVWSRRLFNPDSDFVEGHGVSALADGGMRFVGRLGGEVDVGGELLTTGFDQDGFVLEYDPAGALVTARRLGGDGDDLAHQIATRPERGTVVVGELGGPADLGGGVVDGGAAATFLAAFDASGGHRWSRAIPQTLDPVSLVVTPTVTHLAATFSGTIDLGRGPLTSAGGTDLLVATFDDTGALIWAERFGGAGDELVGGITRGANGDVYLAGSFTGTIEVGGATLSSQGTTDLLVIALQPVDTPTP